MMFLTELRMSPKRLWGEVLVNLFEELTDRIAFGICLALVSLMCWFKSIFQLECIPIKIYTYRLKIELNVHLFLFLRSYWEWL